MDRKGEKGRGPDLILFGKYLDLDPEVKEAGKVHLDQSSFNWDFPLLPDIPDVHPNKQAM